MKAVLGVFFLVLSANAFAISFDVVGGSYRQLPHNWVDFNASLAPNVGNVVTTFNTDQAANGEGIYLTGNTRLRYEYLGSGAYNNNHASSSFFGTIFDNYVTPVGTTVDVQGSAGALDFTFTTDARFTTTAGSFTNAVGGLNLLALAVFEETPRSIVLLFGDGLGDSNLGDMMVRVSAVPIPSSIIFFASAMGCFASYRRFKAKRS